MGDPHFVPSFDQAKINTAEILRLTRDIHKWLTSQLDEIEEEEEINDIEALIEDRVEKLREEVTESLRLQMNSSFEGTLAWRIRNESNRIDQRLVALERWQTKISRVLNVEDE